MSWRAHVCAVTEFYFKIRLPLDFVHVVQRACEANYAAFPAELSVPVHVFCMCRAPGEFTRNPMRSI